MPILSYLAFPVPGRSVDLGNELNAIPGCESLSSSEGEVLVLVTDTADEEEERRLQERLRNVESLLSLAMVYARSEDGIAATGPPSEPLRSDLEEEGC